MSEASSGSGGSHHVPTSAANGSGLHTHQEEEDKLDSASALAAAFTNGELETGKVFEEQVWRESRLALNNGIKEDRKQLFLRTCLI